MGNSHSPCDRAWNIPKFNSGSRLTHNEWYRLRESLEGTLESHRCQGGSDSVPSITRKQAFWGMPGRQRMETADLPVSLASSQFAGRLQGQTAEPETERLPGLSPTPGDIFSQQLRRVDLGNGSKAEGMNNPSITWGRQCCLQLPPSKYLKKQ